MTDNIIERIKHYLSYREMTRTDLYNEIMNQLEQRGINLKWSYKSWCFALQGARNYNLVFVHQLNKHIKADSEFIKYYEEVLEGE